MSGQKNQNWFILLLMSEIKIQDIKKISALKLSAHAIYISQLPAQTNLLISQDLEHLLITKRYMILLRLS